MFQTGRAVLAVVACALVCACDDAPPAAEKTAANAAPRQSADKGASLPPEMVAAVSASKSSLLIGVHFALGAPPTVGKPLPVDIAVVPHRPFTSVRVHFDSQDGLQVTSGSEMPAQADVKPEKVLPHKLVLQPTRDGVFMLTAAVETEAEEGTITRIYSIPVIVHGTPAAAGSPPPPPATAPRS
jgi:hypothetical protein